MSAVHSAKGERPLQCPAGSRRHLRRVVLVAEHEGEYQPEHERITCEAQPDAVPVANAVDGVVVDDGARRHRAEEGAEPVRHDHEESLGARADAVVRSRLTYMEPEMLKKSNAMP